MTAGEYAFGFVLFAAYIGLCVWAYRTVRKRHG